MITVTPVNPVNGLATTFTIGFPQQQLSGTYTLQLGTGITRTQFRTNGDVDTNQNAGLDVLRGQSSERARRRPSLYTATDLPKAIPAPHRAPLRAR